MSPIKDCYCPLAQQEGSLDNEVSHPSYVDRVSIGLLTFVDHTGGPDSRSAASAPPVFETAVGDWALHVSSLLLRLSRILSSLHVTHHS